MILPTRRTAYLLAAASPVLLLGYWFAYSLDVVFLLDVMILTGAAWDGLRAPSTKHISVRLDGSNAFSMRGESEIVRTWTNTNGLAARLTAREYRPEVIGGLQGPLEVEIEPDSQEVERLSIKPVARGHAGDGWVALRSLGPWGLATRQWRVTTRWDRPVFPSIPATRLKAAFGEMLRRKQAGIHEIRRRGGGRLFESLRDWTPGDDTRWIDWKASAKHRKLMSRQYEDEQRQQVMILVDAGRLATAEIEGEARFEYAVQAALTLALVAAHFDDDIGLMVFSDEVHNYVPPQRGRRALSTITKTLAVAEPRLAEPDYAAAFAYLAARNRKRAMAVLFTDVIDPGASAALVAASSSLTRRHLPVAVTLRNPGLEAMADTPLHDSSDAYRRAAAEELLLGRLEALGRMRRSGVLVLNVHPADAASQASNAYIELKRSGRF